MCVLWRVQLDRRYSADSDLISYSQSDADRGYFDSMTASLNTDERCLVSLTQVFDDQFDRQNDINSGSVFNADRRHSTDVCQSYTITVFHCFVNTFIAV